MDGKKNAHRIAEEIIWKSTLLNFWGDITKNNIYAIPRAGEGEVLHGIKGERNGQIQHMEIAEECVDIKNMAVNIEAPITTKMMKYLAKVRDPYRFRVGKIRVHVIFGNERGASIESGLEKILRRKM